MVSAISSNVLGQAKRYGEYGANFLFGTGAERMGKEIGLAIKARSRSGLGLTKSIGVGFKKGLARTNSDMAKHGFFKNLGNTLSSIPKSMQAGWAGAKSANKGFFGKLGAAIKPIGKAMPFLMNVLWLASSVPDIIERTKDEGIFGGIKETGKALANMAIFSVSSAVGATFGLAGMLGLPILASIVTGPIIGQPYSVQKAAKEEALKQQNPFIQEQTTGQKLDYMAG